MENRTAEKRSPCLTYALIGALSLVSGIVGVMIGGALIWFFIARPLADQAALAPSVTPAPPTPPPLQPTVGAGDPVRLAPARVAREVGPSVVTVVSQLPSQGGFFGTFQP
ncbi:MAG: S1C family serine protease, partial [Roseiflexus sp.]